MRNVHTHVPLWGRNGTRCSFAGVFALAALVRCNYWWKDGSDSIRSRDSERKRSSVRLNCE